MFKLNTETIAAIEKYTGKTVDEINQLDDIQLVEAIESKINKKLTFPMLLDRRHTGRGSVFLFLNRFINMELIDKKISLIGR